MPPIVSVRDLTKTYSGGFTALDHVSLDIEEGEIIALLGPNGAGKTTTMRMLYTLMTPDQGSISVDGIDAAGNPVEVRRHLGVLPDAREIGRASCRERV